MLPKEALELKARRHEMDKVERTIDELRMGVAQAEAAISLLQDVPHVMSEHRAEMLLRTAETLRNAEDFCRKYFNRLKEEQASVGK